MSCKAMELSRTAARIRRIIREARSASEAHSELMRAYRITGPAQRTELYGVVAAELIAHVLVDEAMRDVNLPTAGKHDRGGA